MIELKDPYNKLWNSTNWISIIRYYPRLQHLPAISVWKPVETSYQRNSRAPNLHIKKSLCVVSRHLTAGATTSRSDFSYYWKICLSLILSKLICRYVGIDFPTCLGFCVGSKVSEADALASLSITRLSPAPGDSVWSQSVSWWQHIYTADPGVASTPNTLSHLRTI